ncbi:hypothetical protein [Streptomyces sp. NPDC047525]|uniref:hypothetical protein n=1 Tax=Streptomyces sp. NPDC047525 TaxID=3155264 RepID=UPI003410AEBE
MSAHLTDRTAHGLAPDGAGRVRTPSGRTISAAAARRVHDATPANTERARTSRTDLFTAWCREHGRIGTDPGTVPDYAAHLADLGYRAETVETYAGALAANLAVSGHPLDDEDRAYIRAIVNSRAAEESRDESGAGDVLQASPITRADLAAMIATRGRDVAGIRDRLALCLHWYMAGRASEPASLSIRDVREVVAELLDEKTGELLRVPALEVTLRRSKINPHGRSVDVIRILSQHDDTCPVRWYRAWSAVLAAAEVISGPLLRRVRNNKLTTAGRPPGDKSRAGGIGDRKIRNLIAECALAARLAEPLSDDERAVLSTKAEREDLAQLPDDAAVREAFRAERRHARRELRRRRPRHSGHSMRRGCVRHLQQQGTPRHLIETHCRYTAGSRALARYLDETIPWADNPTRPRRQAAAGV